MYRFMNLHYSVHAHDALSRQLSAPTHTHTHACTRSRPHDKMLQAVAEALHLSVLASSDKDSSSGDDNSSSSSAETNARAQWEEMTERDAERLIAAGGLRLEQVATSVTTSAVAAASVQRKFCYQYIRPWEKESSVQVLRLREEVMKQRSSQVSTTPSAAVSTPKKTVPTPRAGMPQQDSKRRRSLLMAMRSPLGATRSSADTTEQEDSGSERAGVPVRPMAFASPRCKEEILTPSRSSTSVLLAQRVAAQPQPPSQQQQQQEMLRTPEVVMTGKRKRVSVTISPPQMPRAQHAVPVPQLSSSCWVSPKPELLARQQQQQLLQAEAQEQQPPRKTRRLSEAGAKVSMTSFLVSKLCAFFTGTRATTSDTAGASSDDATSGESGTESDKSEVSTACAGLNVEFGNCDLYGGNATLLADIQDALEPVLNLLETTSSRLQRVVWRRVRDLSSPFVRIPPFENYQQPPEQNSVQVSELVFDGFEFGDDDDTDAWTSSSNANSSKLVVRTRRQCREMRQLSAAWRLW